MDTNPSPASRFAQRALEHIRKLAAGPRGSATAAEKQAADYVVAQLRALGITDVRVDPFSGLRSLWLFMALVFGVALVGHAAFWLLKSPIGEYPALVIVVILFAFSGFLLLRFFTFHNFPLKSSLPHGESQNVISVLPPAGQVCQRVVLVGHLDSHRAVFWFATDLLLLIFLIISLITVYGVFLAIPVYILAVVTQLKIFGWLGLFLAAFHFLGWFTGVTADLGRYSPGANDNASAVGTLLVLAERLMQAPLQNTEVWLAFTGCEESGCDGMKSLIQQHGNELKEAVFLDFEMVGIGDRFSYTVEEGNIIRRRIPPELDKLLKEMGASFELDAVKGPLVGAFDESGTLWEYGFKAVCISTHYKDALIGAEWHRLTDTPSRIQLPSLERTQELAWALLQRLDQRGL